MANRGVNKVILLVSPLFTYNGGTVANISIATSETWKNKNTGEQKAPTE